MPGPSSGVPMNSMSAASRAVWILERVVAVVFGMPSDVSMRRTVAPFARSSRSDLCSRHQPFLTPCPPTEVLPSAPYQGADTALSRCFPGGAGQHGLRSAQPGDADSRLRTAYLPLGAGSPDAWRSPMARRRHAQGSHPPQQGGPVRAWTDLVHIACHRGPGRGLANTACSAGRAARAATGRG